MSETNAQYLFSCLRTFLQSIVRDAQIDACDYNVLTVIYNNEENTNPFTLSDDVMNYEVGMIDGVPALRRAEDGALLVDFGSEFELIHEEDPCTFEAVAAEHIEHKQRASLADVIVVIRSNETYYTFGDDARILGAAIGVSVYTCKGRQTATFPAVALDTYLPRIIRAGHRVAIVDNPRRRA